MQYRKVPKNGDELSILGYGTMRLPVKNMRIDKERAKAQIYHAIDCGVNYIDTAYIYHMGNSEKFLGEILQGEYRKKVKLATKLPAWMVKKTEDFDKYLNEQLSRLRTDHIEYYLVHSLNSLDGIKRLVELGLFAFLERAKAEGRIGNIGFSYHGGKSDFKEIIDLYNWAFVQIQYNYFDENHQAGKEGLLYAAERDIAVFVMEPLRGGSLANKIPHDVQKIYNKADVKRTPAQWALRWVWNHPGVTLLLSGMNEESHIEENLAAAEESNTMTEQELQMIQDVKKTYHRLIKVPCTACRYCLPCPAGVDIPSCFELYNEKHMFPNFKTYWSYASRLGGTSGASPALASQCIECGQCEKHCPQHIKIRKELKAVKKEMEGFGTKALIQVVKRFKM